MEYDVVIVGGGPAGLSSTFFHNFSGDQTEAAGAGIQQTDICLFNRKGRLYRGTHSIRKLFGTDRFQ
jgi:hypothetical protein